MKIQRVRVTYDDFSDYVKSAAIIIVHPDGSRTGYNSYCPVRPLFSNRQEYRGKLATNNAIGKMLVNI